MLECPGKEHKNSYITLMLYSGTRVHNGIIIIVAEEEECETVNKI